MDRHQLTNLTLSTCLGIDEKSTYCVCVSFLLSSSFFFNCAFLWLLAFPVGPVHYSRDQQTSFFNETFIKNGPTALFTHLKIILLQYFQFSVFNKISSIQIHP